ncbi:MAG: serine protease, partial [Okeania sp. SIO3B3]|nr:serine protease [Okeania sp. SIO3B3]
TEPGEDVYKGMSGGAVLNEAGQLVGIHVGLVKKDGDGEGVLISTFLRMVSLEVSSVLVRGTPVALPSPTRENRTVRNSGNPTPVASPSPTRENRTVRNSGNSTPFQSQDAEKYFHQGLSYSDRREYKQAIAEFNQAIQINPKYAFAYYARGIAYKRNRNQKKAISDFDKAADLYKQQGNQEWYQRSLDQLKELRGNRTVRNSGNPTPVASPSPTRENRTVRNSGNFTPSQGQDAEKYFHQGLSYSDRREYKQAIAEFNQAIQINPKYAFAYYARGIAYKRNRNQKKAISDFEKAAELYKQQGNQEWYQNSLDQLKELRGS